MAAGAVRIHTATTVARVRWTAPLMDGVGHAYLRAGHEPAACGALPIDERFGYGVKTHCEACLVVMGAEEARTSEPPVAGNR